VRVRRDCVRRTAYCVLRTGVSRVACCVRRTAFQRADTSAAPTQYAVRSTLYVFSITPNATLQIRCTGGHKPEGNAMRSCRRGLAHRESRPSRTYYRKRCVSFYGPAAQSDPAPKTAKSWWPPMVHHRGDSPGPERRGVHTLSCDKVARASTPRVGTVFPLSGYRTRCTAGRVDFSQVIVMAANRVARFFATPPG
jgi:hypothetical protein